MITENNDHGVGPGGCGESSSPLLGGDCTQVIILIIMIMVNDHSD